MLSTDLVPVHNDIWRKLPLFLKGFEPSLWRRQKGHKGCDLNTDPEVFLLSCIQFGVVDHGYFCTHCLHFTGPTLWIYIWARLEYWSAVKILEVWAGKLKHQPTNNDFISRHRVSFIFFTLSTNKTGECYSHIHWSAPGPSTPHSETEDFCSQNMTENQSTAFVGAAKRSNAYRTMGAVVKVCI